MSESINGASNKCDVCGRENLPNLLSSKVQVPSLMYKYMAIDVNRKITSCLTCRNFLISFDKVTNSVRKRMLNLKLFPILELREKVFDIIDITADDTEDESVPKLSVIQPKIRIPPPPNNFENQMNDSYGDEYLMFEPDISMSIGTHSIFDFRKSSSNINDSNLYCYMKCVICSEEFQDHSRLRIHSKDKHGYILDDKLIPYMYTENNNQFRYECHTCYRKFETELELKYHFHPDEFEQFTPILILEKLENEWKKQKKRPLKNSQLLNKHRNNYYEKVNKKIKFVNNVYVCKVCLKCFTQRNHIISHVMKEHFKPLKTVKKNKLVDTKFTYKDNSYICDLCKSCFKSRLTAICHFKQVHLKENKILVETNFTYKDHSYICSLCKSGFKSKVSAIRHFKQDHESKTIVETKFTKKDNSYICNLCKSCLKFNFTAIRHFKNMHSDESIIEKSLEKKKSNGNKNKKINEDITEIKQEIIVKKSVDKEKKKHTNGKKHKNNEHKSKKIDFLNCMKQIKKTYYCNTCTRLFRNIENMKKHIILAHHMNFAKFRDNLYHCNLCEHPCKNSLAMKKHMKKNHI